MWSREEFADPAGALGQQINREMLAEGLMQVQCVYAGSKDDSPLLNEQLVGINFYLKPYEQCGTVELYANGAINAFVKPEGGGAAIAVIKYRPDSIT